MLYLESEVVPLFIVGVCIVTLLELIAGCMLLKNQKKTRTHLIAHAISMAIAMVFLIRCLFGKRLGITYGDSSAFNSVNIALFGIFWAISVVFLLLIISSKIKQNDAGN